MMSSPHHPVVLLPDPRPPIRRVTPNDEAWPRLLGEAPGVDATELFLQGTALPGDAACIAIVGTRTPTVAGREIAADLATAFAQAGFPVVSGLAVGIDAVAHRAALGAGGTTVAVVGAGLAIDYPQRNRSLRLAIEKRGVVMSRYPDDSPPLPYRFPERNHIIAGIATATVVVEGGVKSGALITARSALDAGRMVFAVPGSIRNAMATGPNELIKRSEATPVTTPQDVFDALAPLSAWPERLDARCPRPPSLTEEERVVVALLDDVGLAAADLRPAGLEPGRLGVVLAHLELRGLVARDALGYRITTTGARARAEVRAQADD